MTLEPSEMTSAIEAVDLFCGVGALSYGLKQSGIQILCGYDVDTACQFAYEKNVGARFFSRDVETLTAEEVKAHFSGLNQSLLAGCAPCQPFSTYTRRYAEDHRWRLLEAFCRIATEVLPDYITMENVPSLAQYQSGKVFNAFCDQLSSAGYLVSWRIVKCEQFGIPQRRRRLVLIASRAKCVNPPTGNQGKLTTVRDAISHLPVLEAGSSNPDDLLHASAALSLLNLKRIRASKPGGTWEDWPASIRADCHKKSSGRTYRAVYGRMSWEDLSPTITTQAYGYGSGRFGHPEQDRAISLREAACLQSFPDTYQFVESSKDFSFSKVGRWIGNAVPVKLAEEIGLTIGGHVGLKREQTSGL